MNEILPQKKWGLLLIQVGTPSGTDLPSVKKFLTHFLMDPHVIDIPWLARFCLVRGVIVPRRAAHSARLYRAVFTAEGSPLKSSLTDLSRALAANLKGEPFALRYALQHGTPSIPQALQELLDEGITGITLMPLFPQETLATTTSAMQACRAYLKRAAPFLEVRTISAHYSHPLYILAWHTLVMTHAKKNPQTHLLCSYHSVPLRHLRKTSPCSCHAAATTSCEHPSCYHAQCLKTTKLLAASLGLKDAMVHHAYQSQMGRSVPWLGPDTHALLSELPGRGVRDLIVVCPGFVTRCLETIEEIGVQARREFLTAGGDSFTLVPSLDDDPSWIHALTAMVRAAGPQHPPQF